MKLCFKLLIGAALWLGASGVSFAQSVQDFYRGKTLDLYIGYSVGGGYDIYARAIGRYLGRHIPGQPTVVPRNMDGAGSLRLTNWINQVAPRDGSAIGAVSRSVAFDPLLGTPGVNFRGDNLNWIGSANDEVSVCVTSRQSGILTIDDAKKREVPISSTGINDDTGQFPRVINALLGTKFKIITGYPGGSEAILALERGEVEGRCGWSWSSVLATHKAKVDNGDFIVIIQTALRKHPDLPNVPDILSLVKTDDQKKIVKLIFARQTMGRPFVAPPGIPDNRLEALRTAFLETLKDPDFLQEAKRSKLEINAVSGTDVQKLVREAYATPPDIVQQAIDMLR